MTGFRTREKIEYIQPDSLAETLRILKNRRAGVRILAGGTDLILQVKQGLISPSLLVDVKNVPELNRLEWTRNRGLHIGAAVPLAKLVESPLLAEKYGILAQACGVIGSMQIRNRGTMGGNICNAAPSADSAPPLLCLGAIAVASSGAGTRTIDLVTFFTSPGKTALRRNELLVEIEVPTPPARSAGCYMRHTTREEMDIAVAGVASFLVLSPRSTKLKTVRIALGAVAPTPIRAYRAEALLTGKAATQEIIEATAEEAAQEARPISDIRASAEYRRELVKVLTRRTLRKCCEALGIDIGR